MAHPDYRLARAHKRLRRGTGTAMVVPTTATGWTDLGTVTNGPGAAGFDMVLEAEVGDQLEYGINAIMSNSASDMYVDILFVTSGKYWAAEHTTPINGFPGWQVLAGVWTYFSGSVLGPAVEAGDLNASGQVTVRPMVKLSSATAKTWYSDAGNPSLWWVKNIGPVDPY